MTSAVMRAKMVISSVNKNEDSSESLTLRGVCKEDGYDKDGKDENNTFATFSPSVDLNMTITNPELHGKFSEGQQFYVDFTEVA